MNARPLLSALLAAVSIVSLLLAGLSLSWYYDFCASIEFNELGRYFDKETSTVFTDSNCFAGAFAVFLAIMSAGAAIGSWRLAPGFTRKVGRVLLGLVLPCTVIISGWVLYLWR